MRIEFQTQGGIAYFPGLAQPVMIDTAQLPSEDAARLESLIQRTHFFELPARVSTAPAGAADYRQYQITVEDGERRHRVLLDELGVDPNLQALVAALQRYQ